MHFIFLTKIVTVQSCHFSLRNQFRDICGIFIMLLECNDPIKEHNLSFLCLNPVGSRYTTVTSTILHTAHQVHGWFIGAALYDRYTYSLATPISIYVATCIKSALFDSTGSWNQLLGRLFMKFPQHTTTDIRLLAPVHWRQLWTWRLKLPATQFFVQQPG